MFVCLESPDVPGGDFKVPLLGDECCLGCGRGSELVSASFTGLSSTICLCVVLCLGLCEGLALGWRPVALKQALLLPFGIGPLAEFLVDFVLHGWFATKLHVAQNSCHCGCDCVWFLNGCLF